jgi:ABC-type sugar transport system ATPase subunit
MDDFILEMKDITKEFPGVRALDNVSFRVKRGEIHALVGENGAGKSTLMKVLAGVYPAGSYSGQMVMNDKELHFTNTKDSERAGISIIFQELALVKQMSIQENIFLGDEITRHGIIDWNQTYIESKKVLEEVRLTRNPATAVRNLGVGEQQLVEIAKAVRKRTDILILDEPSAALTESEIGNLFQILRDLKAKGVTCIYISHKLSEVFDIADRVTVLRDGRTVATSEVQEINENRIISLMVGRELTQRFPTQEHTARETVLEVKDWTVLDPEVPGRKVIDNVSFTANRGEILGIAGLMGAGRTELAMSLFGAYGIRQGGEIYLEGKKLEARNPHEAILQGITYLSEDRKRYGFVPLMDVRANITLSSLEQLWHSGVINSNEEVKIAEQFVTDLAIKTPSVEQKVGNLSGGNQQKVALSKWLLTKPKVLLLDEPTRGIDVGAKFEIYNIMNRLVDQGVCIIMISSELPEILGMSDRILVMHEGKMVGDLPRSAATQERVMFFATGGQ